MKKNLLHLSMINKLVRNGEVFSFKFVDRKGIIIEGKECVCTSFHSAGRTMNVKWLQSELFRKVRRCSIVEFDGLEVVL